MTRALAAAAVCLLICLPALSESKKDSELAGAVLFRDKGCAYCHGAMAQGTPKAPSLANLRKTMKPEQISNQILNGGRKMPAFEDSLSKDEVGQLVAYLRAKHRPTPPAAVEPAVKTDPAPARQN